MLSHIILFRLGNFKYATAWKIDHLSKAPWLFDEETRNIISNLQPRNFKIPHWHVMEVKSGVELPVSNRTTGGLVPTLAFLSDKTHQNNCTTNAV